MQTEVKGGSKKVISIVIPAFNEEACIETLTLRLQNLFAIEKNYLFEVFLIENGSTDRSWDIIKRIAAIDSRFKGIRLSRNFQMDGALSAGIDVASGNACVLMAADLQDPPEVISEFTRKWEEGWENVYARVQGREGVGIMRKVNTFLYYSVANLLTQGIIKKNISDFRLLDEKVYKTLRGMKESSRMIRGMVNWLGFRSCSVDMIRPPRFAGKSKASFKGVFALGIKGILSNSNSFLQQFGYILLLLSMASFFVVGIASLWWISFGVPFAGFGIIVALQLLSITLNALLLSLLLILSNLIYREGQKRPNYVIAETINC